MTLPSKDKIYGNCQVFHPDGTLMFRCDQRRASWYIDRNLCTITNDDPLIIKLNFEPKGKGHVGEPYYLFEKQNRCVVCGSEENLTRHHAVPICYRKHFPEYLKSRNSHDIVPLCSDCHEAYETQSWLLKQKLAKDYDLVGDESLMAHYSPPWLKARGAAAALFTHKDKIPQDRQLFLKQSVADYLKKTTDEITDADIEETAQLPSLSKLCGNKRTYSYGKSLVDKIENLEDFIYMWRQHFVSTMNPKHLPEYWDVNHRLKNGKI